MVPEQSRFMDIISELRELARNLWWTWQPNVIALFRDLDPALWRRVIHNPIAFLSTISREALESQAFDLASESRMSYAVHRLHEYPHRERSVDHQRLGLMEASRDDSL